MATETRNPTSDVQESGTITGGTAGTRYTLVDDHPDSSGADYLQYQSGNAFTRFGFSVFTVPAAATINHFRISWYGRKVGASSSAGFRARAIVNGTTYSGTTINPTQDTWVLHTETWLTNPNTGSAWTVDDVNGSGAAALQSVSIQATDVSPEPQVASVILEVDYTASSTLTFTDQPQNTVEDAELTNVVVTSNNGAFTGDVTVALEDNPAGGVLSGDLTKAAVGGVATFDDLEVDLVGTYTLSANATGHVEVESTSFNITLLPATNLVFLQHPTDTQVDAIISPAITVRARNSENVVDTNFTAVVTITIGDGAGALSGDNTKACVAGVATFDDLDIDTVGNDYTLLANATGLTEAESGVFDITASAPPSTPSRAFSIRMGSPLTMRL